MVPDDRRYTESHEWAKPEDDLVVVGITDFAVEHLTDLVYLELPNVGDRVEKGERFGEVESVKAVEDLKAPVSGEIVEVHTEVAEDLEIVQKDPYGEGWLVKIRPEDPSQLDTLLDPESYRAHIETEAA